MQSDIVFKKIRVRLIVVSTVVTMTFLAFQHPRVTVFGWQKEEIYLGNQGVRLQTGINDCGPASLQMIFDHYEIPCTIQEIKRTIKPTEKGSTMLALKEMSELKGLHAEGWQVTVKDLSNILFPAILFTRGDHFVVADSVCEDDVFVRDPAIGRLKIAKPKLSLMWKGEILLFKRK